MSSEVVAPHSHRTHTCTPSPTLHCGPLDGRDEQSQGGTLSGRHFSSYRTSLDSSQAQRCPSCPLSIFLAAVLGEDLGAASPRTLVWIISPPPHFSSSDSLSNFRLGSPCCLTCTHTVNPVRTHVGHGLALYIFPGMLWSSVVRSFLFAFHSRFFQIILLLLMHPNFLPKLCHVPHWRIPVCALSGVC